MNTRALAAIAAVFCPACISASSFTTARTIEPDDVRHTIGLAMYGRESSGDPEIIPLPAVTYALTYGIMPELDITAQASLPGRLRFDAKYNPIREDLFDLAIAPALYGTLYPSTKGGGEDQMLLFGAELPLLMDFNTSRSTSFVLMVGPAYGWAPGIGGAPYVRTGLGFSLRGDGWSFHPEVNMAYDPIRVKATDVSFGLGVTLGALPSF